MLDGWLIFSKVEINLLFWNITKTYKLYPCCRGRFSRCYRMLPVKQTKNVTTLHKSNFSAIFLLNTTSVIWSIFLSSVVIVFWKDAHVFVKWEQKCLPGFEYHMGYSILDFSGVSRNKFKLYGGFFAFRYLKNSIKTFTPTRELERITTFTLYIKISFFLTSRLMVP